MNWQLTNLGLPVILSFHLSWVHTNKKILTHLVGNIPLAFTFDMLGWWIMYQLCYTWSLTGELCTTPLNNFTHAKLTLTKHSLQLSRNTSIVTFVVCSNVADRSVICTKPTWTSSDHYKVRKHHEVLKGILKAIFWHNIALRGHHGIMSFKNDESTQSIVTSEGNPGNFLALLGLLVEFRGMVLKENLSSAPNNAKYQTQRT